MAHVRANHDPNGETLTVSWSEPSAEHICEETGEGLFSSRSGSPKKSSLSSDSTSESQPVDMQ
jgi:hypothetical protein